MKRTIAITPINNPKVMKYIIEDIETKRENSAAYNMIKGMTQLADTYECELYIDTTDYEIVEIRSSVYRSVLEIERFPALDRAIRGALEVLEEYFADINDLDLDIYGNDDEDEDDDDDEMTDEEEAMCIACCELLNRFRHM